MFVLERTDQGGGYVGANSGHTGQSYVHDLRKAKTFSTRDQAETERCVGNEIIVPISELLQKPR